MFRVHKTLVAATVVALAVGFPACLDAIASDKGVEFETVLNMEGDPEYGEYLAGDCVTCHQASGHVDGIPAIVGLPKDYFIESIIEYRSGIRSNQAMQVRAQNLTNEDIAALAAFFEKLRPE